MSGIHSKSPPPQNDRFPTIPFILSDNIRKGLDTVAHHGLTNNSDLISEQEIVEVEQGKGQGPLPGGR